MYTGVEEGQGVKRGADAGSSLALTATLDRGRRAVTGLGYG
jgi:hypothetical protein